MKIIILPPVPIPKKITAKSRSLNLEQHLKAFLCSNNPIGFNDNDFKTIENEFIKILYSHLREVNCSIEKLKKDAFVLKKLFNVVQLSTIYTLLANMLGYKHWSVVIFNTKDCYVRNLNYGLIDLETDLQFLPELSSAAPRLPNLEVRKHNKLFENGKKKDIEKDRYFLKKHVRSEK